jgi:hypothetical protein
MDNSTTSNEQDLVNPNTIQIRVVPMTEAKPLIVNNHYTGKWSSSKICFGVFENLNGFGGNGDGGNIIGVVVYGPPVGASVSIGISPRVKRNEVLELKRLWIEDGHGKNVESFVISQSFKLLRIKMPEIKMLVSYADPAQGHHGGIYQATNWVFQELNITGKTSSFSVSLVENPKPKDWIHSRTIGRQFAHHNIELLKRYIGRTFLIKHDSVKYRYLYCLCPQIERRRILKSLNHPIVPYRKDTNCKNDVQTILVDRTALYGSTN